MKTRLLMATGVILLAVVAVGAVVLGSREGNGTSSPAPPACRLIAPSPVASTAESSGVRIAERGFSRLGPMASMGVLLRNDTTKVAYRTLVTFDALDTSGRTVIDRSHQRFRTQVVPTILPGEVVAVGNANLLDDATQRGDNEFTSMSVNFQVSQWLPRGSGDNGLGKVTATVVAGSGARTSNGQGSLAFDVESTNCATTSRGIALGMASRGVSLVFRNGSGAVIGGSLDNVPRDTCRPGKKAGERVSLSNPGIPSTTDLDRTLVTLYCDFDRPGRPPASDGPYN